MIRNRERVDILLSTYNGADYIEQQIGSIRAQTFDGWRLIIRDDGSKDATRAILERLAQQDDRIHVLSADGINLGPAKSFLRLLTYIRAPNFMFSDQDDFWLPKKVEMSLNALAGHEHEPHLVFTDAAVVNEQLRPIAPSFMKLRRFDARVGMQFNRVLMQNVVMGCTIAGNRALLDASGMLTSMLPTDIIMHDWLLALVAAAFGTFSFIDEPTMLYRQHSGNYLGATGSGMRRYVWMLLHTKPWVKAQKYLGKVCKQAVAFGAFYDERLSADQLRAIRALADIQTANVPLSLCRCFRTGVRMHAYDRNVALLLSNVTGNVREYIS